MICNSRTLLFCVIFLFFIGPYKQAIAKKQVTLATVEHEPYIGIKLPNKGYLHELVTVAFQRVGYSVNIHFYPVARAKYLAIHGLIDGYFPTHIDKTQQNKLMFSASFPGDNIGFLKKKNTHNSNSASTDKTINAQLHFLKNYQLGVIRGANISPDFDKANYLKKQFATNHLQNLDKLMRGRLDFVVGDRYTLADMMVSQRPHLIGQLDFLPFPLFNNAFHVAFSKKNKNYRTLKNDFNLGLTLLSQDGTLEGILTKHGLFPPKIEEKNTIKLTIGTVNNKDMLIMKTLSEVFEQTHPYIDLQWRVLPETTLRKRLLSDLAISDGQFDIMTIGSYETSLWAKKGWLTVLDNFPSSYEVNDLLANVQNSLSYQEKLYALPFYSESSMMFYRKDLFDAHHLVMPEQPTYDDIVKFAATIHNPEKEIYGICMRGKQGWGENIVALSSIVYTHNGRWFNQQWRPMINSLPWKKALATYIKLISQYSAPSAHLNGFNENLKLFKNGHCAIWIDATVAAGVLFDPKQSRVFDKTGYTLAPISKVSEGAHWLWSWALAIPASSKHKPEAQEFITWATSKQYIEKVASHAGWLAVPPGTRKSTYENKNYLDKAPFVQFVLKNIQDGRPLATTLRRTETGKKQYTSIPEFHAIGDYIGTLLVEVIEGNITQKQALKKSQTFAEKIMKRSGYYKP